MILDAEIGGAIRLRAVPPRQTERLRKALSFPNPQHVTLTRMGKFPGNVPERIEAMREDPCGDVVAPRGSWSRIQEALGKDGWSARKSLDLRAEGTHLDWRRDLVAEMGLRDYQGQGIARLLQHLQGLIVLPCGTGKSRLGGGAIAAARRSALVLVHTTDLADQWCAMAGEYLHVAPARIFGDRDERGPLCVATVQSIARGLERDPLDELADYLRTFGLCILDEAHHAPAETFQRVLEAVPARLRLGLTATPDREDGLTRLVEWSFGPVLLERDTREMIRLGFLTSSEIEFVETAFRDVYDGPEEGRLTALDDAIEADPQRNALIAQLAAGDGAAGSTVLVLTGRREHAGVLARLIGQLGVEARACTSSTSRKRRRDMIEDLRAGDLPVMVATSLADEGLDVQRLSRVILAWPGRSRNATTQRVGRLLRNWPSKKPKLYDLVDSLVPTLASRAAARRTTYRKLGLLQKGA